MKRDGWCDRPAASRPARRGRRDLVAAGSCVLCLVARGCWGSTRQPRLPVFQLLSLLTVISFGHIVRTNVVVHLWMRVSCDMNHDR